MNKIYQVEYTNGENDFDLECPTFEEADKVAHELEEQGYEVKITGLRV
jgi:hypothetical protein